MSIVSPSICHEGMGPDAMILIFWMLSFKPNFSLSSFTFIKRLFSSSSLPAIKMVSFVYLKLLIFFMAIFHFFSHFWKSFTFTPCKAHFQKRHRNGQRTHEKMINISSYQRNAHQNYNEGSLYPGQNGHHQKVYKQ